MLKIMGEHATLRDAILHFAAFEDCRELMTALRWPGGNVKCPACGAGKVRWLERQRLWKCYAGHPRPTFSLKTGTIFEDSPIPLEKWLPAVWMLMNCKNGISSYELHRALEVTQKTAWFMLHRIRLAMQAKSFTETGTGKTHAPSVTGERFKSTPEFRRFGAGMKSLLTVSKKDLDIMVMDAKYISPRRDNPNSPGRKPFRKQA